jgi:hypothetical protein
LHRITGLCILSPNICEQCIMHNSFLEIRRGAYMSRACFFEGSGRIVIGLEGGWIYGGVPARKLRPLREES